MSGTIPGPCILNMHTTLKHGTRPNSGTRPMTVRRSRSGSRPLSGTRSMHVPWSRTGTRHMSGKWY